ncbi:PA2779 family protein [Solimonas soli]|uniref:PA2779 family protein n=1 Tax=Solimonas soli TaxID=413479 RepID=UPI00048219FE|nr:PA2779 family protein [Solimonas soli]
MYGFARGAFTGLLCLGLALSTAPAGAEMIGTEQLVAESTRADDLQQVQAFMSRDVVIAQFEQLGVDPADARQRVAALSDAELRQLAQNIDQQPAGGDVLAVIGVVFVVLIILELVGVTHIFSRF